ncbi:MAG: DUF4293 domain-containing protein [Bacteroidales bacterium]
MILQRLQSVFLFLAMVLMVIFSFQPFMQFATGEGEYVVSALGAKMLGVATTDSEALNESLAAMDYSWVIFGLSILVSIFTLITIFSFKNLKKQKGLCMITVMLIVALVASIVLTVNGLMVGLNVDMSMIKWGVPATFPVLAIILILIARGYIAKDQKILSSYDRIR